MSSTHLHVIIFWVIFFVRQKKKFFFKLLFKINYCCCFRFSWWNIFFRYIHTIQSVATTAWVWTCRLKFNCFLVSPYLKQFKTKKKQQKLQTVTSNPNAEIFSFGKSWENNLKLFFLQPTFKLIRLQINNYINFLNSKCCFYVC